MIFENDIAEISLRNVCNNFIFWTLRSNKNHKILKKKSTYPDERQKTPILSTSTSSQKCTITLIFLFCVQDHEHYILSPFLQKSGAPHTSKSPKMALYKKSPVKSIINVFIKVFQAN
jgi:hypothetical protein